MPKSACFLLLVFLVVVASDAFTTVSPPADNAPPTPAVLLPRQEHVVAVVLGGSGGGRVSSPAFTTSTNLPSQRELFAALATSSSTNLVSSVATGTSTSTPVVASTSTAAAANPAPAKAPSAPSATTPTNTKTTTTITTSITITDIAYDGRVPKTEADEYVVISNTSKNNPVDISGYDLYVATTGTQGPTFTFPKGSILKPGAFVRVYTNEIHKETGGYSFGSGKALWNNKGGLAVLRDGAGNKVGEFQYKGTTSS